MEESEKQDLFGYIDGDTFCAGCGALLDRDNAWWAMGRWWHKLTTDCQDFSKESTHE